MNPKTDSPNINLWSGNRTQIRQEYERDILKAILKVTEADYGLWQLKEYSTELPGDQESKAFTEKHFDVLVTIAGNQKFKDQDYFMIKTPLAKNLLGYRLPIVHKSILPLCNAEASEEDLKNLVHGIPETWCDVQIFEENGYTVLEKGNLDQLFERLSNKEFDYSAFGANEILSVFESRVKQFDNLKIADGIIFYYPFPLVFYVNPAQKKLAERLDGGLERIQQNGAMDSIFNSYYGTLVQDLKLNEKTIYRLDNPFIPEVFNNLQPDFKHNS